MARVRIARADGEIGTIDEADLEAAKESGFRVVDEAETKAIRARNKAATISQTVLGVGESAARGVTLGLYDSVRRAQGADMEAIRARKVELGDLGAAAEVAGAIAPTFFTGGAGGAATAARLTPAALAARAGAATTRLVEQAGLGRVAGSIVQGAVEGGLGGLGQAVGQQALADQDLEVERAIAGGFEGLGIGALLGGGVGVTGKALEVGASRAVSLGESALGKARGLVGEGAESLANLSPSEARWSGLGRSLARLQGRDPEIYGDLYGGVATRKGRDRILADAGEVQETTAREIKVAVDSMNAASSEAFRLSGGVNKRARMASLAPEARPRANGRFARGPRSFAIEHIDNSIARLDNDLRDELLSRETRSDLLEVKRIYEVARRDVDKVKTPDQAFMAIDDAKRSADAVAARRFDQYENNRSPEAYKAWQRARSFTDDTRFHLEDDGIYGDMALSQRRMNAAIASDMAAQDALPPLLQAFMAKGAVADTATAMAVARKSTRFGGESQHEAFQKAIDARLNRLRVTRAETELTPEQVKRFDEAERAIEDMRAQLEEAGEVADVHDRLAKARKDEGGGSPSLTLLTSFGPAAGAGLGFMVGGVPGAMAGSIAGLALRPFTLVRGLAAAGNMLERFKLGTEAVATREAGIVANFERLADGGRTAARTAARSAQRAVLRAQEIERPETQAARTARLLATRVAVLAAATDPSAFADNQQQQVAELHDVLPDAARAIVERSAVAIQFLASRAPDVYESEFSSAPPIVDPAELDRFERYVEAVQDPLGAVDKISRGVLNLEAAETLRVVYPRMYAELQGRVLEMLGRRKQEGRPISYEARVQLGLLLDMPLDDSLQPGFATMASGQPPLSQPQLPAPARRSKPYEVRGQRTDLGRLESGELRR